MSKFLSDVVKKHKDITSLLLTPLEINELENLKIVLEDLNSVTVLLQDGIIEL